MVLLHYRKGKFFISSSSSNRFPGRTAQPDVLSKWKFQPTPVDGVYGTKDVLLTPIRVDATMNGPLSIIVYMDGFRFTYNIFRLIVVNQTATAAFSSSSPSSRKS